MFTQEKNKPYYFNVETVERYNDEIVFWSLNANRLLGCNISNGNSSEIYALIDRNVFGGDSLKTPFLYTSSTHDETYAYFAPFESDKICRYRFSDKECDFIQLKRKGRFSGAFIHDGKLYLWGWGRNNVQSVSLKENSIRKIDCFKDVPITSNPTLIGKKYYFTINEPNTICSFNPYTEKCIPHILNCEETSYFNTISYSDGVVWLSGTSNVITLWNIKKDDVKEINLPDNMVTAAHFMSNFLFRKSIVFGHYVYFSPYKAKHLVRINRNNNNVESLLIQKRANGGSFIKLSEDEMHFIVETGDHQVLGEYRITSNGELCESALFSVPRDSLIATYAPKMIMWPPEDECNGLTEFVDCIISE